MCILIISGTEPILARERAFPLTEWCIFWGDSTSAKDCSALFVDLLLVLYFLAGTVPLLCLLKALNWAGVSGEQRWMIEAISPQNLWLDLAEVRFALFAKWARPGFSAEAIKSHFAPPSIPNTSQMESSRMAKETEYLLSFPGRMSDCITSQREAWMSLHCPGQRSTEAGLIKCWIQLQSHYKRLWPTTFISGVLSCGAVLYCRDLIN